MSYNSIATHIITYLSTVPRATSAAMHAALRASGKKVTIQGLFKELRALRQRQIVLKIGRTYTLSLAWLWSEERRIQSAIDVLCSVKAAYASLPEEGGSTMFHFPNLIRMKLFWSHLVLAALRTTDESYVCSWNEHPWFYLILEHHEEELLQSMKSHGTTMYKIIGSNTKLDRIAVRFWKKQHFHYSFLRPAWRMPSRSYFSVVGDYFIFLKFPPTQARLLDSWYKQHKVLTTEAMSAFISIVKLPCKVTIVVEHSANKAATIRAQFKKHFT